MGLEKINEMRKSVGLNLDELSIKSGVPKGTLSKITAGITKNPSIETIKSIVHCMGFTLDDLDETEKSPVTDVTATRDAHEKVTVDQVTALLEKMGYVQNGQDLSDKDLAFLLSIGNIVSAWFDKTE